MASPLGTAVSDQHPNRHGWAEMEKASVTAPATVTRQARRGTARRPAIAARGSRAVPGGGGGRGRRRAAGREQRRVGRHHALEVDRADAIRGPFPCTVGALGGRALAARAGSRGAGFSLLPSSVVAASLPCPCPPSRPRRALGARPACGAAGRALGARGLAARASRRAGLASFGLFAGLASPAPALVGGLALVGGRRVAATPARRRTRSSSTCRRPRRRRPAARRRTSA